MAFLCDLKSAELGGFVSGRHASSELRWSEIGTVCVRKLFTRERIDLRLITAAGYTEYKITVKSPAVK